MGDDIQATDTGLENKSGEQDVKQETSVAEVDPSTTKKTDAEREANVAEAVESSDASETNPLAEESLDEYKNVGKKDDDGEGDEPSNVQKRINKLIAKQKALEEELKETKANQDKPTETAKPKYTREQLNGALKKGIAEGDSDLVMDVLSYSIDQAKDELRNEYLEEKNQAVAHQKEVAQEWNETVLQYEYLSDGSQPDLYKGAKKDLDLKKPNSLLKRLANDLYAENPEKYARKGGQKLAVTDALMMILRKKAVASNSSEKQILEKKLAKEKMKSQLPAGDVSGAGSEEVTSSGPLSENEKIEEYVKERQGLKASRTNL